MGNETNVRNNQGTDVALAERERFLLARESRMAELVPTGLKSGFDVRSQIRSFAMEAYKNPELLKCEPITIAMSYYVLTALGLGVGSALGHAYLIPRWNSKKKCLECQPLVGYRGMIYAAHRSGAAKKIWAQVIRDGDRYEYQEGDDPSIKHWPKIGNEGSIICSYAVAEFTDGTKQIAVVPLNELEKIRERATKKNDGSERFSPYQTDEVEMYKKTAIRRLNKQLPTSTDEQRRSLGMANAIEEARDELDAGSRDIAIMALPREVVDLETGEVEETAPKQTITAKIVKKDEKPQTAPPAAPAREPQQEPDIIDADFDAELSAKLDADQAATDIRRLPDFDDGKPRDGRGANELLMKYTGSPDEKIKRGANDALRSFLAANKMKKPSEMTDVQRISALDVIREAMLA